jgi:hypothetical protein
MGIDFHAITIPEYVFEKYKGSMTLQLICSMQFFCFDAEGDEDLLIDLAGSFVLENDFPPSDLDIYRDLIRAREFPTDVFGMGNEWRVFDEVFEDLADQLPILGKVFHSGEDVGVADMDAISGQELVAVTAALKKVRLSPDNDEYDVEWFNASLTELCTFYENAIAKQQVVFRGFY